MALADLTPAGRHRAIAGDLSGVVRSVRDWDAPAPVADWQARDVVAHLVEWFPGFLAAGGVVLPAGPAVADDPVGAWQHQADAVQALLDDEAGAAADFTHPFAGTRSLADTVDSFYTADVFMHTWDLATAAGVGVALEPAWCEHLLGGLAGIDPEMLRGSGQYGPPVPVPDDADPQTRLVAFIGRDPSWTP